MSLFGSPSIEKLEKRRKVDKLIEILDKPSSPDEYSRAAAALGRIGSSKALDPLIESLSRRNKNIRVAAVKALGDIGNKNAEEPLLTFIKEENEEERKFALKALYKINGRQTPHIALSIWAEQWAKELADAKDYHPLAAHLCSYGHLHIDPYLGEKLHNTIWYSKEDYACITLHDAGVEAVDAMIAELKKGENKSFNLAMLFVDIGDPRAVPILKPFVDKKIWNAYSGSSKIWRFVKDNPQYYD